MIQTHKSSQNRYKPVLSRLGVWLGIGMLLVLMMRVLSFWPQGPTATYFENLRGNQLPAALVEQPAQSLPHRLIQPLEAVNIDIWFLPAPRVFVAEEIFAKRLERGLASDDRVTYAIEFDEAGLNHYLTYWFEGWVQQTINVRNATMDLKPNGLIVYGEVDLGLKWQRMGAVFNLDASGRQFIFAGIDLEGQLLATPPLGPIAEAVTTLELNGNRALRELKFIDAQGNLYIQQIILAEEGVQVIAQ